MRLTVRTLAPRLGLYTTLVLTRNGQQYDLGLGEHPPVHPECRTACDECLVVNAWMGLVMWDSRTPRRVGWAGIRPPGSRFMVGA